VLLFGRRKALLSDPKRLGRWGERRSERFLKGAGLRTIARNYRCKVGEVDIVMADDTGTVVFVEVKTRADEEFTNAQDAVGHNKRKKLGSLAKYFLKSYNIKDKHIRFDVVAVVLGEKGRPEIRHYKNAFIPPGY
jgi:putative endonuclease